MVAHGTDEEDDSPRRKRREKSWCVCYTVKDKPKLWWMMKVRGADESAAWEAALKKLKREGLADGATMKYASCLDD